MPRRKFTIEEINERIRSKHGDVVTLDESTYTDTATKARFIDKDYGEWWAKPCNVISNGSGNPNRYNARRASAIAISVDKVKERINKIHSGVVTLDESTYVDTKKKARFIDRDYGEWTATPNAVLMGGGHPVRGSLIRAKKNMVPVEHVVRMVMEIHNGKVRMDESTYKGVKTKARFIDKEHGEWWVTPSSVLRGHGHRMSGVVKHREVCMERYGVDSAMKDPEIALRSARATKHTYIRQHWLTGEELVCQASYESKVVDYFNEREIDFLWQSQTFEMPDGHTYRPDMYRYNGDGTGTWIEIKGYMRPTARVKWEWFLSEHPNAELWDKAKLKEIGIL